MERVTLSRKWLGPLDGIVIAKLVARNCSLMELDLSHNMLGQRDDVAIVALSEAFGDGSSSLQSVNLSKNYISVVGALALGRALQRNSVLKVRDLRGVNGLATPLQRMLCYT